MQIKNLNYIFFILISVILFKMTACQKNQFITTPGAGLTFSMDTLTFDTVFTNMGNATRRFKVYNPHAQIIRINNVTLGGGTNSDYKINIDGQAGVSASNIEIPAGDSIYIFATVHIDPNNGDAVRVDSIMFETDGGGTQQVILHAYGWNAIYIGQVNTLTQLANNNQTVTLNNNQPYVFSGIVTIDNGSCLVIPAGTEIYMFGGPTSRPGDRALIYIGHNSCIRSNVGGNLNNPVEIKTHRLEEDYQLIPFHHNGIYLSTTSRDNVIHGTIIRNAVDGIVVDSASINSSEKLDMKNCKIFNVERSGVLARGSSIKMTNTVLANSNQFCFIGIRGGDYNFRHCTFANTGAGLVGRNEPILSYRNYEVQIINNAEVAVPSTGNAYFTNCIIYGNKNEEVEVLTVGSSLPFTYEFNNCLMKVDTFSQNMFNCLTNLDPEFNDPDIFDYQIDSTSSPANNAGTSSSFNGLSGPSVDAYLTPRDNPPAIGAYAIPN